MAVDLEDQFAEFLDEVSIGEPQTSRMQSAADAIIKFLMSKYDLPAANFFLQGSYPNGTAVEPVDGGEYDVDLVAVCVDTSTSANEALDQLASHFESDGRFKDRVVRKKPCIRLEYVPDDVGKFHVDVVPVRMTGTVTPPLEAPRKDEGWHGTAPAEYKDWCVGQGDGFARTVKALKRWRDEQQTVRASIKSIVLQVLVAQHMPPWESDSARVGGTIMELHQSLISMSAAPRVENPVYPDENLAARWTKEGFLSFVKELGEAAEWVSQAEQATDEVEACEAWREVLGDDFPSPNSVSLGLNLADTSHEKSFGAKGWRLAREPAYSITVRAEQQRGKRGQTRRPYASGGPPVFAGHRLRFKASVVSPGHSAVWWQVTNTGAHADSKSALRGEFLKAKSISQGPVVRPNRALGEHGLHRRPPGTRIAGSKRRGRRGQPVYPR